MKRSKLVFERFKEHLPTGSGICKIHRVESGDSDISKEGTDIGEPSESLDPSVEPLDINPLNDSTSDIFASSQPRECPDSPKSDYRNPSQEPLVSISQQHHSPDPLPPSQQHSSDPILPSQQHSSSVSNSQQFGDTDFSSSPSTAFSNTTEGRLVKSELTRIENRSRLEMLNQTLKVKIYPLNLNKTLTDDVLKDVTNAVDSLINIVVSHGDKKQKDELLEKMFESLVGLPCGQVRFASNVFESLRDYCTIINRDHTRSGIVRRKIVCEALTGELVKTGRQLDKIHLEFGLARKLVTDSVKLRLKLETSLTLTPLLERLARKPPTGERFVTMEWKLKVCQWFEEDAISEVLKGTHQLYKERVKTATGIVILCRQKRIIRTSLYKLKELARKEINWPFSLRSLFACRPSWILLPKQRYLLGCLCEICQNVSLLVRAVSKEVFALHRGTWREKAAVSGLELSPSATDLVEKILHTRKEGKEWHDLNCYDQLCNSTECGAGKYRQLLAPLLSSDVGKKNIEFFQHEKISYKKPDGSRGSKWELLRKTSPLSEVVEFLEEKMFGHKKHETYLQHVFKKLLGSKGRSDLRKNIGDNDLIVYSDFSKGDALQYILNINHAHTDNFRITIISTRGNQVRSLWSIKQDICPYSYSKFDLQISFFI